MSNNAVHPMVLKAARAWCKRHAEACGLDEATLWAEREAGFITEAQAALEACGAMELLDLAHRFASECGDCAGTRVMPDDEPCGECTFIWDVIALTEVRS